MTGRGWGLGEPRDSDTLGKCSFTGLRLSPKLVLRKWLLPQPEDQQCVLKGRASLKLPTVRSSCPSTGKQHTKDMWHLHLGQVYRLDFFALAIPKHLSHRYTL